jgi:hypothetical protein
MFERQRIFPFSHGQSTCRLVISHNARSVPEKGSIVLCYFAIACEPKCRNSGPDARSRAPRAGALQDASRISGVLDPRGGARPSSVAATAKARRASIFQKAIEKNFPFSFSRAASRFPRSLEPILFVHPLPEHERLKSLPPIQSAPPCPTPAPRAKPWKASRLRRDSPNAKSRIFWSW